MKICTICHQTYQDEQQNYCLNDGSVLVSSRDEAPPTMFMNSARPTEQANWSNSEPISAWQSSPLQQNQPFPLTSVQGKNQTLPTISMVLGILSFVLICCYGGIPIGIAAIVTGYLGLNNFNKDPMQFGGRGLAITGLILGGISFFVSLVIGFFAIIGNIG